MTAAVLHRALVDAGLKVRQVPGWETRGQSWADGQPVGVMHHHTAAPVPFPVDRLYGDLLKCNMNIKPDGTVWLVAYGACNYSSGSGSSKVLAEVKAGKAPSRNALDRGLADDTNGNPFFWNSENDHHGLGGLLPDAQEKAIVVATNVVNDHFRLTGQNMISHACWTRRKHDPYWNGNRRAIDDIRDLLEAEMKIPKPSWLDWSTIDRLIARGYMNSRPSSETEDMWRTYAFLDRADRSIVSRMEDWVRKHVKTSIAAALAAGAGSAQVDYGELVRRIGETLAGG